MTRKTPQQVVVKGRKSLIIYGFLTVLFISTLAQLLSKGESSAALLALLLILLFLWKASTRSHACRKVF